MNIIKYNDEKQFTKKAIEIIHNSCKDEQTCTLAISGGNTPQDIYRQLGDSEVSFDNTKIYLVDERYVPLDHTKSNTKAIYENLITDTNPLEYNYFDTSLPIEEALKKYEKRLPKKPFDLCILGIGTDGHTASLFPESPALQETTRPVAHTQTDQNEIKDRLTLTFPKILSSKKILVLLKGKEKEAILETLQNPPPQFELFPAKKLLEHQNVTVLYLK